MQSGKLVLKHVLQDKFIDMRTFNSKIVKLSDLVIYAHVVQLVLLYMLNTHSFWGGKCDKELMFCFANRDMYHSLVFVGIIKMVKNNNRKSSEKKITKTRKANS